MMLRRFRNTVIPSLFAAISIAAFGQSENSPSTTTSSGVDKSIFATNQRSLISNLLEQDYPIRRLISAEDIKVQTRTVRFKSGKKATLVVGSPKKAQTAPAVFVIDVESSALAADPIRWFGKGRKSQEQRAKRIRYLLNSPFGSNLLGNGFVVAYLIAEDIETLRSARTDDWLAAFEKVRNNTKVDEESFFLLSTREYANLSLHLASNYRFTGVILEEPSYMLFSRNPFKGVIERSHDLSEEEIWNQSDPTRKAKYRKVFSTIHSPLLLVRSRNTLAYTFNEKTLIPGLLEANAFFEEATFDSPARQIHTLGEEGVMNREPKISYNSTSTSLWLEHMLNYLRANSRTEPIELALPYPNLRR